MPSHTTIEALIERCDTVDAAVLCEDVEHRRREGWRGPCLVVRRADGEIGIVSESHFLGRMAGTFGYGRSLWGKRPIAEVAHWGAPSVTQQMTLVEAAELIVATADGTRELPVTGSDGAPLGVIRPVRVMRAMAESAALRAAVDELTQVASRSRFIEELEGRLGGRVNEGRHLMVAFIDLDRLKPVNDALGHTMGDRLLRSVARRLTVAAKPGDLVGRLGGDEFAVLGWVPETVDGFHDELALAWAESLRAAVASRDPELPALAESRASVGVAVAEAPHEPGEVLRLADEAMYAAKAAGGDRVRLGSLDGRGARGARTDGLWLAYQPVVRHDTGELVAVEALLRTSTPDGVAVLPRDRLAQASASGAALALDMWVLERACTEIDAFARSASGARDVIVHVNLSPESLRDPHVGERALAAIRRSGLPPARVCLELSEYAVYEDVANAQDALRVLAAAGVRLALDDMGARVGLLRAVGGDLAISVLKVDRSVIEGAGRQAPFDTEMLDLIVRLARRWGIDVVAEGIETDAEVAAVSRAGVSLAQGFVYARPLDLAGLADFAGQAVARSAAT